MRCVVRACRVCSRRSLRPRGTGDRRHARPPSTSADGARRRRRGRGGRRHAAGGSRRRAIADDLIAWAGAAAADHAAGPAPASRCARHRALASARLDIAIAEAQIQQTYARDDWHVKRRAAGHAARSGYVSAASRSTARAGRARGRRVHALLPTGGTSRSTRGSSFSAIADVVTGERRTTGPTRSSRLDHPAAAPRPRPLALRGERAHAPRSSATPPCSRAGSPRSRRCRPSSRRTGTSCSPSARSRSPSEPRPRRGAAARSPSSAPTAARSRAARSRRCSRSSRRARRTCSTASSRVLDRSIALRRAAGMPIGAGELGAARRRPTSTAQRPRLRPRRRCTERAFAASPELAQLAKQDASATIDIEVNENGLLPQLDAALSLGPTGQDGTSAPPRKNMVELKSIAVTGPLTFAQLARPGRRARPGARAAREPRRSSRSTRSTSARRSRRPWRARSRSSSSRSAASRCPARNRAREREHPDRDRPVQPRQVDELRRAEPARGAASGRAAQGAGDDRLAQGGSRRSRR